MEFPRQEYWSGQPIPSPGYLPDPGIKPSSLELQAVSLPSDAPLCLVAQLCLTLCDPIDGSPPGSPIPGILQARVGCHFLLQCMKVKSESEVPESCPTLCDPMDYPLPGSSFHGIFQARVLEWVAIAFSKKEFFLYISYLKYTLCIKSCKCVYTHTCA